MADVLMTKDDIKKIIPHREPMLFVDSILEMEVGVSIKSQLTLNLEERTFFQGHFPEESVMPGVLTVEAMAQTADVLLLSTERYSGTIPLFIGIDEVKFKSKIKPGDTLIITAEVFKENKEKAIVTCDAVVYDGDVVAASGKVTLAMRPVAK